MKTIFVGRHLGAKEWVEKQGYQIDEWVEHLDLKHFVSGDHVIGTLPIQLAAEVCRLGGRYFHLEMHVPFDKRGHELSCEELEQLDAKLTEFIVERL